MTEEELRKEVKEYLRQQTQLNGGGLVSLNINNLVLGFAEKLNKQLIEKENQIEKMKRCENCEHCYTDLQFRIRCRLDKGNANTLKVCRNFNMWNLAEK